MNRFRSLAAAFAVASLFVLGWSLDLGRAQTPPADEAVIKVKVPAGATLRIGTQTSNQRGTLRTFYTGKLVPGYAYQYEFTVTWSAGGKEQRVSRWITIRPGETKTVELGPEPIVVMPKKEPPKKEPPKKETPKKEPPKKETPKKEPPKKELPKKVDPKKTDPKKVDPKKTEPKKDPSPKVEPKKVDPKKVEPKKTDPMKVDPKKTEPKKIDPKKEPTPKVEPKNTEPGKVDPKKVDPKKGEPKKDPEPADKEGAFLSNPRQVTKGFVRAGEGYFSPDGRSIIFQAEEKGPNPFYQMFVQDLKSGTFRRVSPGTGKTTCGYFRPDGKRILYSSTHLDPDAKKHYAGEIAAREEERQTRKRRRYVWDFDTWMEIFTADPDGGNLQRLTDSKGYDAEASWSADGKRIVFCSNRGGEKNLELYVMDADGKNVRQLTKAPGCYNGGPFFSPDGTKVVYRSDRRKKDHLQIHLIDVDGKNDRALTDDLDWVCWGPYWYKDSRHIIFAAADHSDPTKRPNYDLYWMDTATGSKTRITTDAGADVLPVFSPDSSQLLWTSTRAGPGGGGQLFLADFTPPK